MKGLVSRGLPLFCVAVLALNDHVLKQRFPGFVTGKVSDFAGLFFFPLLLTDALTFALRSKARTTLVGACIATAIVFTLVKTWFPAHALYCEGLGILQWPVRALAAVLRDGAPRMPARVRMTMDPTDLVALVSIVGAFLYATALEQAKETVAPAVRNTQKCKP